MMEQPANNPAQVTGLAPQNGSRVTNLTQPVTIAFSEEIMPDTLNEFTFRLEDDFGPVPARIHYFKGHKQATLTPVGLLDSNRNYRVVVTQGVTDTNGRPIRSGINSMFSTNSPVAAPETPTMMTQIAPQMRAPERETAELERFGNEFRQPRHNAAEAYNEALLAKQQQAAPQAISREHPRNQAISYSSAQAPADRTIRTHPQMQANAASNLRPFKVTSIYPGANSDNVSRRAKIAVHFSEPADPKTINNINISIFGNQERVEGKVVYDKQNNRAIFEPRSQLDPRTDYKVIVSDKIKSKMGEPLVQRFTWDFSTSEATRQKQYLPGTRTAEADAAFFIPLVDSKIKRSPGQNRAVSQAQKTMSNSGSSFTFVPSRHWAFKSMRHISNKGILNAFPFTFTDSVTRYEFASAINNALSSLKSMQHSPSRPRLRIADMVELEKLVIEFRSELKSYNVNTIWFESFLQQQGVNLQQIEARVNKLNGA